MEDDKIKRDQDLWSKSRDKVLPGHNACAGCGMILAVKYTFRALDGNMVMTASAGCISAVPGYFPKVSYNLPVLYVGFAGTAAAAAGLNAGLRAKGQEDVTIVAIEGDGGTADIGLQSLSGAIERAHNFVYICVDNEGYMNTGGQRSSTTPYGARTNTTPLGKRRMYKKERKKDVALMLAAQGAPYVATATLAYPRDLMNKIKRAQNVDGVGYVHVLCPCVPAWGYLPEKTIEITKQAVETGVFKLYEIENGEEVTWYKKPKEMKRKPVQEYLELQERFSHLTEDEIQEIQDMIDEDWGRIERHGLIGWSGS